MKVKGIMRLFPSTFTWLYLGFPFRIYNSWVKPALGWTVDTACGFGFRALLLKVIKEVRRMKVPKKVALALGLFLLAACGGPGGSG
ncbi:hypothetical protein, partial [Thermus sp.]|uniref:hypothetical protein n=1 Tax=Thermus sp. TaxID=275 RepID=UPI00307D2B08